MTHRLLSVVFILACVYVAAILFALGLQVRNWLDERGFKKEWKETIGT